MTLLLIGFCFGTVFGLGVALVLVRHERTDKRPGYVTRTTYGIAPPHGPRIPGLDDRYGKDDT